MSKGEPEAQEPGHVRWTEYTHMKDVETWLAARRDDLQIISVGERLERHLHTTVARCLPGEAQRPPINWCPDGIDTMDFLMRCGGSV
jgi:hypothetical protein